MSSCIPNLVGFAAHACGHDQKTEPHDAPAPSLSPRLYPAAGMGRVQVGVGLAAMAVSGDTRPPPIARNPGGLGGDACAAGKRCHRRGLARGTRQLPAYVGDRRRLGDDPLPGFGVAARALAGLRHARDSQPGLCHGRAARLAGDMGLAQGPLWVQPHSYHGAGPLSVWQGTGRGLDRRHPAVTPDDFRQPCPALRRQQTGGLVRLTLWGGPC